MAETYEAWLAEAATRETETVMPPTCWRDAVCQLNPTKEV